MCVNIGCWGILGSFDVFMVNWGIEEFFEGYIDDDVYFWVIEVFEICLLVVERCGVMFVLENYWGLGLMLEGILWIVDVVDLFWL